MTRGRRARLRNEKNRTRGSRSSRGHALTPAMFRPVVQGSAGGQVTAPRPRPRRGTCPSRTRTRSRRSPAPSPGRRPACPSAAPPAHRRNRRNIEPELRGRACELPGACDGEEHAHLVPVEDGEVAGAMAYLACAQPSLARHALDRASAGSCSTCMNTRSACKARRCHAETQGASMTYDH